MFHHVKELQFNAKVSKPDPRFAALLLEQFGGGNGELKAAMQYFVQSFGCRKPYPKIYDMLMDIATEEFSHLEIVGATITMLTEGVNGELKNAVDVNPIAQLAKGEGGIKRDDYLNQAILNPQFLVETGGGPAVTNASGIPWSGAFVNANGDPSVDLRSNIAAETRAKIVYEYLLKFTDDAHVRDTLRFLMTREITHFQQFSAALQTIEPNFPPGVLQGDPRYTHLAFNMSNGQEIRGPWNQGVSPDGNEWEYVEDPINVVHDTHGLTDIKSPKNINIDKKEKELSELKSKEVTSTSKRSGTSWSDYK